MGVRVGVRLAAAAMLAAATLAFAPAAQADTYDIVAPQSPRTDPRSTDGWQAGTCKRDAPEECSIDTPDQFFKQAAGHPPVGFTQIIVKHEPPGRTPVGELKTVRVDLPVGLTVNPQATPQCLQATFETDPLLCPVGSAVGRSIVIAADPLLGTELPPFSPTVYNIIPAEGEPARFGFNLAGNNVYLQADVAWESDYHEGFTIHVPDSPSLEPLIRGLILENRLVFDGQSGDGTFITTPTTCFDPAQPGFEFVYSTFLRADSYEMPDPNFPNGSTRFESPLPPGEKPLECASIPFEPSVAVDPNTPQSDSPSGAVVTVSLPEIRDPLKEGKQATSHVKDAYVTLPSGMGLNPSAANGLVGCTDAQFGKGTRNPVACPAASKVGTVAVQTPPLPPDSLRGEVYVGQQQSQDPTSGQLFRIFVHIESRRFGISSRLVGNTSADPQTGQLTTTFANNPQVPFTSFVVDFDDGPKAPLSSPPICGPHTPTSVQTPWSGNPPVLARSRGFTLTSAPGGGSCAATLAERPFDPGFAAKTTNKQGGAFTELLVDVARSDGSQELKGVIVDMPPGHTAKLAGLRYCPEAAIAAAAANIGAAERAQPSCPDSSLIGTVSATTGTGSEPLAIEGKAFLAGPFNGAPLSLAVVTPATAGPFDLGSVVVRVALFVDPRTAQIRAASDPIPHVFGGVLLGIRTIAVRIDRRQFSINPTNCSPMSAVGTLRGGGANPNDPLAFTSKSVSTPFEVTGCEKLGFKPKLYMRLFGGMRRAKNPKLRAVFVAREGDANVGRAAVALPRTLFLDQASLAKVCTRPQYAAGACPKESIYGFARAFTPLLDAPLQGPVYLRSSDNLLPDLVASLRGQVNIELAGRIDTSAKGGIRNTFDVVPDVPVSKFILTVRGGRDGLLVNSVHQCRRGSRVIARFKAQNGKKSNQRPKLRTACARSKRKRKKSGNRGR
jgi:hypothetical protein